MTQTAVLTTQSTDAFKTIATAAFSAPATVSVSRHSRAQTPAATPAAALASASASVAATATATATATALDRQTDAAIERNMANPRTDVPLPPDHNVSQSHSLSHSQPASVTTDRTVQVGIQLRTRMHDVSDPDVPSFSSSISSDSDAARSRLRTAAHTGVDPHTDVDTDINTDDDDIHTDVDIDTSTGANSDADDNRSRSRSQINTNDNDNDNTGDNDNSNNNNNNEDTNKAQSSFQGLVFGKYLSTKVLKRMDKVYQDLPKLPVDSQHTSSPSTAPGSTSATGVSITASADDGIRSDTLNLFTWSELSIQTVLGQGGFAYVLHVSHQPGQSNAPHPSTGHSGIRTAEEAPLSSRGAAAASAQSSNVQYACKCLKAKNIKSSGNLIAAAQDLFLEAHWLMQLHHPNIIALLGVCASNPSPSAQGDTQSIQDDNVKMNTTIRTMAKLSESYTQESGNGFFLLLPKLERTLLDQFQLWKQEDQGIDAYNENFYSDGYDGTSQKLQIFDAYVSAASSSVHSSANSVASVSSSSSSVRGDTDASSNDSRRSGRSWRLTSLLGGISLVSHSLHSKHSVQKRIRTIALPICEAMDYLHAKKDLIYRDLKPENIGFLQREGHQLHVQLIDFGLARTVSQLKAMKQPEIAGSFRYMAPELIRQDDRAEWIKTVDMSAGDFNDDFLAARFFQACDVYSFAILLWEMITLSMPFADYACQEDFENIVGFQRRRPSLTLVTSKKLQVLLQDCWCENPYSRPTFATIAKRLKRDVLKIPDAPSSTPQQQKLNSSHKHTWHSSQRRLSEPSSKKSTRRFRMNRLIAHKSSSSSSRIRHSAVADAISEEGCSDDIRSSAGTAP